MTGGLAVTEDSTAARGDQRRTWMTRRMKSELFNLSITTPSQAGIVSANCPSVCYLPKEYFLNAILSLLSVVSRGKSFIRPNLRCHASILHIRERKCTINPFYPLYCLVLYFKQYFGILSCHLFFIIMKNRWYT